MSVYEAAETVCTKFEMPAVNNVSERSNKAMYYFSMYSSVDYTAVEIETEAQVSAQADQMEFYEDCIAEMAGIIYA